MQITVLGHAGLFIETRHGTILCDPFFNPAFFASWFPFPSNEAVDIARISHPDYLYISHIHRDHFDVEFLREHVSKDTTVLLPDFKLADFESELRDLGFTKFIHTRSGESEEVNGLRVVIVPVITPTQDPIGDSGLIVDDGEACIFDQNDSHPNMVEIITRHGPFDAHFVQYSGATWYPTAYDFNDRMMQVVGSKKRENGMIRALHYARSIGATHVFPSAGPPCFLDDELFHVNDFDRDASSQFPDASVFLDFMRAHGFENGHLTIPGSVIGLGKGACTVTHPLPDDEVRATFTDKRTYLEAYRERQRPRIDAIKATWCRGQIDITSALQEWFEPLLQQTDMICVGVNGSVLLDCGDPQILIDFQQRRVYPWTGEDWDYRFRTDAALIEQCILKHELDWTNLLFLSMRFQASRKGPFNEYVINFFNSLSPTRIAIAERYHREQAPIDQTFEIAGYRVQRFCPHRKADLTRFGRVEDGILTCAVHGWEFELATGRCLTSDDRHLYARPLADQPQPNEPDQLEVHVGAPGDVREEVPVAAAPEPAPIAQADPIAPRPQERRPLAQCKDCTWLPPRWREVPSAVSGGVQPQGSKTGAGE